LSNNLIMATKLEAAVFWNETKLSDVVQSLPVFRPLVSVHADHTIGSVLKRMKKNQIVSLPVFEREEPIGRVSSFDLMSFISDQGGVVDDSILNTTVDKVLEMKAKKFGKDTLADEIKIFYLDTPLSEIVIAMTKGLYRILVDVGEGWLLNISGRDIIAFLFERNRQKLIPNTLLETPLERLKDTIPSLKKDVKTAFLSDKLLDVMKRLSTEKIGAVPIVNETTNALATTFSASDLRLLPGAASFKTWESETVGQFLKKMRGGHLRKPTTISLNETFETAISRMVFARVNRLWTTEKGALCGIFSMTHVFKVLHSHFGGYSSASEAMKKEVYTGSSLEAKEEIVS